MVTSKNFGLMLGALAFFIWGCFPFYFKQFEQFEAYEVIAQRFIWTCLGAAICVWWLNARYPEDPRDFTWLKSPVSVIGLIAAALFMMVNMVTYVYAVQHDLILEASLGYFLTPLISVALGFAFLGERLNRLQLAAVVLAMIGVSYMIVRLGHLPMIALIVGSSFAFYGLLHKALPITPVVSLFGETAFLAPILIAAGFYLDLPSFSLGFWLENPHQGLLFVMLGPITLIPLILYNKACKLAPLSLVSLIGYLTPTMVFVIAIFAYAEPINMTRLHGFILIWLGLAIFGFERVVNYRRNLMA